MRGGSLGGEPARGRNLAARPVRHISLQLLQRRPSLRDGFFRQSRSFAEPRPPLRQPPGGHWRLGRQASRCMPSEISPEALATCQPLAVQPRAQSQSADHLAAEDIALEVPLALVLLLIRELLGVPHKVRNWDTLVSL